MRKCFDEIHKYILDQSKPYQSIYKQIKQNGVIKIETTNLDFFSFLTKTIISQQISNLVAEKLWHEIFTLAKSFKSSKKITWDQKLLEVCLNKNISYNKKNAILHVNHLLTQQKLKVSKLIKLSDLELQKKLIRIKGVGQWTADIMLIFFFRRLNIFPENDLVINKVKKKFELLEKKKLNYTLIYKPYLSILSLHFWKLSKGIL